ncbi:MAG TPA: CotH kinase family protein, partial [Candidatus Dormibacteraeota bacterium]|nr:CotH kinase family protein [Candidatus Dormibacteraeota bacterium]
MVAWLNGTEILRRLAPDDLHWDSKAVASRPDPEAAEFEVLNLAAFTEVIQPGSNVLAIQALNVQPDDLDLFLQPTLEASSIIDTTNALVYFTTPTPGAENMIGVSVLGPIIQNLNHQPAVPSDDQDLLVTARVAPAFAPITNVTLRYRIMFSNEVAVPMFDDGAHGDGAAGDGIYGASIPATASNPGQMLRYAVLAADALGRTNREPLFSDPLGSPQYRGTLIRNAGITSALPVLHWFVGTPAAAETDLGTRCSIFSPLGEFYDNVFVRIRGGTARGWPKKSYKIELNEGDHYLIHPGALRVSEFDLNATYTDKAYVRAVLTAEHQEAAGVPAPETFHVQLRQNGAFYSVALFVEQPDRDFLRGRGMDPEGSLYKCGPGSTFDSVAAFEKKTRRTEDKSDAQALLNGLALNGPALETFVFDNFDVPAVINFLATVAVTQNIDASDKNLFLYRDTNGTKEWRLLPWDLDLTFGPDALNTDTIVTSAQNTNSPACASHPFIGARPYLLSGGKYNRMIEAIVNTPRTRAMLLRRVRTLTDQFLATTYFQDRIEQFYAYLTPDVQADRTRWGVNAHFPGTTYTFRAALDRIRNEYLTPRLPYLTGLNIAGVGPANPASQPFNCAVRLGP